MCRCLADKWHTLTASDWTNHRMTQKHGWVFIIHIPIIPRSWYTAPPSAIMTQMKLDHWPQPTTCRGHIWGHVDVFACNFLEKRWRRTHGLTVISSSWCVDWHASWPSEHMTWVQTMTMIFTEHRHHTDSLRTSFETPKSLYRISVHSSRNIRDK